MTDVFIGIGSNMGDRVLNLNNAARALENNLEDYSISSVFQTEPRDFFEQDSFLNIVVHGKTAFSPFDLLKITQKIENSGGRVRMGAIPKGPRTIDLDILLYGDRIINTENLKIPHPAMKLRRFVLIPLLELSPMLKDPITGEYYYRYLEKIEEQGVYCYSLNHYNNSFV